MPSEPTDAELVRACMIMEAGAWEALLDRHGPWLRHLLMHRAPRESEEVFQELWVSLVEDRCRRLKGFDPARPLRPYLAALALNLCRKRLGAGSRRRLPSRAAPAAGDPFPAPAEAAERRETGELLNRALQALPEQERLALALIGDGRTYAEAAGILGIPPGSLGALLERAREGVKKAQKS